MKIEIDGFYGAEDYLLLSEFFAKFAESRRLREKEVFATSGSQEPYILTAEGSGSGAGAATDRRDAGTMDPAYATDSGTQTAPGTEAPAKRTRRTKAQIADDEKKEYAEKVKLAQQLGEASNISTTPEDRQDPEFADDEATEEQGDFFGDEDVLDEDVADDLIDGYAVTDEGLVAAMKAYVAKFDMAAAQTNAKALFGGYTKRSEVTAAGEAAIATAIRNFANAVNTGKAA